MEKENVLEIEFKELWDNFAWRITKQNEEILKRNNFEDEELNVESFESPEFRKAESKLFIKGHVRAYDNNIQICTAEEKALIEEKVKAINEKYGIKKRWRAKKNDYYQYINSFISIVEAIDLKFVEDNERYKVGNYFKTKELAEKFLADFKKFSMKWHEENGADENEL